MYKIISFMSLNSLTFDLYWVPNWIFMFLRSSFNALKCFRFHVLHQELFFIACLLNLNSLRTQVSHVEASSPLLVLIKLIHGINRNNTALYTNVFVWEIYRLQGYRLWVVTVVACDHLECRILFVNCILEILRLNQHFTIFVFEIVFWIGICVEIVAFS